MISSGADASTCGSVHTSGSRSHGFPCFVRLDGEQVASAPPSGKGSWPLPSHQRVQMSDAARSPRRFDPNDALHVAIGFFLHVFTYRRGSQSHGLDQGRSMKGSPDQAVPIEREGRTGDRSRSTMDCVRRGRFSDARGFLHGRGAWVRQGDAKGTRRRRSFGDDDGGARCGASSYDARRKVQARGDDETERGEGFHA